MNITLPHYYSYTDDSLLYLLPFAVALIILGLLFYMTEKHLNERLSLPLESESPEDKVHFVYRGDRFTMTREEKEIFDMLDKQGKNTVCKNIKKAIAARLETQNEANASLNKYSNKKEEREALV